MPSHALFPLTPALSLGEREPRRPSLGQTCVVRIADALALIHPLPEGEGRGEGEGDRRLGNSRFGLLRCLGMAIGLLAFAQTGWAGADQALVEAGKFTEVFDPTAGERDPRDRVRLQSY